MELPLLKPISPTLAKKKKKILFIQIPKNANVTQNILGTWLFLIIADYIICSDLKQ